MWKEGVAGMTAGTASTLCMHPLDLLKIRYQLNLNDNIFQLYKKFGLTSLYRGLSANLLGNASSWGLYFCLYSFYKDLLGKEYNLFGNMGNFTASVMAGCSSLVISNPIWIAKTRMCRDIELKNTIMQVFNNIYLNDGIKGFYRGVVPGLFGVVHASFQMSFYEWIKRKYHPQTPLDFVFASTTSKIMAIFLTYPYQVVKSRMQASSKSLGNVLSDIFREKAFYRGITPATMRVLPGTAITFVTYETILKILNSNK